MRARARENFLFSLGAQLRFHSERRLAHIAAKSHTSDCTCAKGIGQQETLWQKQSHRLTDIVKNNEGVWISTKLFYIVGSLSLLSIITIAIEIAFYVYFKWIV